MKNDIKTKIEKLAKKHGPEMIKLRRQLHQNPEIALTEFQTQKTIAAKLKETGCAVNTKLWKTSVVGLLKGKDNGKTIGIRSDMDALPDQLKHIHGNIDPTGFQDGGGNRGPFLLGALMIHDPTQPEGYTGELREQGEVHLLKSEHAGLPAVYQTEQFRADAVLIDVIEHPQGQEQDREDGQDNQ